MSKKSTQLSKAQIFELIEGVYCSEVVNKTFNFDPEHNGATALNWHVMNPLRRIVLEKYESGLDFEDINDSLYITLAGGLKARALFGVADMDYDAINTCLKREKVDEGYLFGKAKDVAFERARVGLIKDERAAVIHHAKTVVLPELIAQKKHEIKQLANAASDMDMILQGEYAWKAVKAREDAGMPHKLMDVIESRVDSYMLTLEKWCKGEKAYFDLYKAMDNTTAKAKTSEISQLIYMLDQAADALGVNVDAEHARAKKLVALSKELGQSNLW